MLVVGLRCPPNLSRVSRSALTRGGHAYQHSHSSYGPRTFVCARLTRDKRGSAAVEFAFLAPLLTLMLLGTIEMGRAINMHRVFNQATD